MQSNCIFPGRFAPFIYYDWHRGHEYAITSCQITMSPPLYTLYNKYAAFSLLANVWFCSPSWLLQHSEQKLKIRNTWVHAQHGTYSVAHARRNRACWLGKTASLYACTTLQSMKVLSECSLMLSFQLVMCLA